MRLFSRIVSHGPARTEQGERVLSFSDYGYGSPGGCLGINCGHMLTPFIIGANYKLELGEDVKSITPEQAVENANAEAKQRVLERAIRANKEKLHVAEKLGDMELISRYKSKVRTQQSALRGYIEEHLFLKRDREREKYYPNPAKLAKQEVKQRKHLEKVKADYENIKKILGDDAPATIAKYQRLLYNGGEEYVALKDQLKWVEAIFPSEKSFEGHYQKHRKEFPDISKEEYQQLGAKLLSRPVGSDIFGYETENGRRVRYDRGKNIFIIGNLTKSDQARINTILKPDEGEKYYHENHKRDFPD